MTVQYLIDSENVGDFWIPLLDLPVEETELIVFYTRNSPHMSYDSLIKLKESSRTVTFIKCYEGTNALDFQLVSELGYRICESEGGRFVIVTNDTGFDAAVKYWRRRKKSVKRITGKEAKNVERRIREDLTPGQTQESGQKQETIPVRRYTAVEHDADHDAHVDAYHAESAQDPDGRPSRSNLRDAETASEPETEEVTAAGEEYSAGDELEMEYDEPDEDVFSDEDFEEDDPMAGADDEEAGETESESSDEPEEELFYAGPETSDMEDDPEDPDGLTAEEERIVRQYADLWSEEDAGSADAVEGGAAQEAPEETAAAEDAPAGEAPAGEAPAEPSDGDYTVLVEADQLDFMARIEPEQAPVGAEAAGPEPVEREVDKESPEETEETASVSEPEPAEETEAEETAETQHHGRTRRSRSRRSRSSSKKQDQQTDHEETGDMVPAEEDKASDRRSSAEPAGEAPAGQAAEVSTDVQYDPSMPPGDEEIARIVACIGAENLAELHNQLATFYGDQGKDIYLSIKNNTRSLPVLNPDLKQKFAYYCEIIFARSDYTGEYPADISEFLLSVREKLNNLNSLRYALQKHYGKEKGRRFYFLLKPFAKSMYQM